MSPADQLADDKKKADAHKAKKTAEKEASDSYKKKSAEDAEKVKENIKFVDEEKANEAEKKSEAKPANAEVANKLEIDMAAGSPAE